MKDTEGARSAPGAGADRPAMVRGLTGAIAAAFSKLEERRERSSHEISRCRLRLFRGRAKAQFARAALAAEKSEPAQQQHLGKVT